ALTTILTRTWANSRTACTREHAEVATPHDTASHGTGVGWAVAKRSSPRARASAFYNGMTRQGMTRSEYTPWISALPLLHLTSPDIRRSRHMVSCSVPPDLILYGLRASLSPKKEERIHDRNSRLLPRLSSDLQ